MNGGGVCFVVGCELCEDFLGLWVDDEEKTISFVVVGDSVRKKMPPKNAWNFNWTIYLLSKHSLWCTITITCQLSH